MARSPEEKRENAEKFRLAHLGNNTVGREHANREGDPDIPVRTPHSSARKTNHRPLSSNTSAQRELVKDDKKAKLKDRLLEMRTETPALVPHHPVILDLSVIFGALVLKHNDCIRIMDKIANSSCSLIVSNAILSEMISVVDNSYIPPMIRALMGRPSMTDEQLELMVQFVCKNATNIDHFVDSSEFFDPDLEDKADARYLIALLALDDHDVVLITRDRHLLKLARSYSDRIMHPRDYIA